MKKETFCFGNGDFLIIEKKETNTIPCHFKIIAGGEQEIDLLDNLVRHITKRALDLRESAASQSESTPEVDPLAGEDTTPPPPTANANR